jgi:hypothetical protein
MSECTNLEMRDLLPDYARGLLTGATAVLIEDHLMTCAECRAELRLVRSASAVLGAAPRVDTVRIVDAVARSQAIRRSATASVAEARRRRAWSVGAPSRRVWLAAASIAAIVTAAVIATPDRPTSGPEPAPTVAQSTAPVQPAPESSPAVSPGSRRSAPRIELVMGGGVSDLADADLESLLQALDDVDTELDVEPAVLLPVMEGDV